MIKSFLFLVLGLIVSNGTGALSAPVAETPTKPTLDQTAEANADGKRTFREAVLNNEASSENRAFVGPGAQIKDGGNRLISTLKKWSGVDFVMEKGQQYRALKRKLGEFIITQGKKLFNLIEQIRKPIRQRKFEQKVARAINLIKANVELMTFVDKGITPNAYMLAQKTLMKELNLDAAACQTRGKEIGDYTKLYNLFKLTKD